VEKLKGVTVNLSYGDFDIFPETRLTLNIDEADYEDHLIKR